MSDGGLEHLAALGELRELGLIRTRVSDAGVMRLKRLAKLKSLVLVSTQVTDAGCSELQRTLPACRIIHFSKK